MDNELITLLHKAYNDGIVTSIIQTKINNAKKELNLSDAEFQKIDDQIRIATYLKKLEERKGKGDVYIGDLTKQYKITEEEKILLKGKKSSELIPVQPIAPVEPPVESKPVQPIAQAEQPVESKPVVPTTQVEQPAGPKPVSPTKQVKQTTETTKTIPPITQEPKPVEPKQVQPTKQVKQDAETKKGILPVAQEQQAAEPKPVSPTKQVKQTVEPKPVPPVKQVKQTAEAPAAKSAEAVVLIVDDNPNHIALTKKCMEKNGYVCHTADSPEAAIKLAVQISPSIVLCDFNFGIGKQTGLDLLHELKSKKMNIPFIIISAYYQQEFVDYAFGVGVTDYLTKPFEPETLLSTVKQHLSAKK